ncbi:hypothetical protein AgCh_039770 [Apium graveolens]
MQIEETRPVSELKNICRIFSEFMTRVTKFEELVDVGCRLLNGFQQALGFLRKLSIAKSSELVESIIKANATRRVLSYVEAGCVNTHDRVQNMNKLHTCQVELLKHLNQAKDAVNELEGLVEDAIIELGNATEDLAHLHIKDSRSVLDLPGSTSDEERMLSSDTQQPEITDYATMMAVIYSMVKQDYFMQEKIISALNLNSTSEELESYSLMWSLRPYIDDEVMHQAWRLVH